MGNRTVQQDPTGIYTMTYTSRNLLSESTNPDSRTVSYTYDARRDRASMTDPDGGRFTYTHDALQRQTSLINAKNEQTTMVYDAVGRMIQKQLANGTLASQTYDLAGRLDELVNLTSTSTTLSSFHYSYDGVGNRTAVVEADGTTVAWQYDRKYQLLVEERFSGGGWEEFSLQQWESWTLGDWEALMISGSGSVYCTTFTYDPGGNRLTLEDSGSVTTYTYDAANQLLQEESASGVTSYSYDNCGNRTEKDDPAVGITYYSWDTQHRLIQAEPPSGVVTFTYNAGGQRVRKENPSEIKKYLYDFQNLLMETDDADTTERLYTSTAQEYGDLIYQHKNATKKQGTKEVLQQNARGVSQGNCLGRGKVGRTRPRLTS